MFRYVICLSAGLMFWQSGLAETTQFCLEGELDLGARFQGLKPQRGEFHPTSWCVVTDSQSERVRFSGRGNANPDMYDGWTVAYFPPDIVRIVNRDSPPDLEFHGTDSADEALSVRRLDPHRLLTEYFQHPARFNGIEVVHADGLVESVRTSADLPLRGRVAVVWRWDWSDPRLPRAELTIDGDRVFRGVGRWEVLSSDEATATWAQTPGPDPVELPGANWPARVAMERTELTDGVHLVTGVRTGFQHLVIETREGLVVGDAPAGWVELHQIPPSDLVPGLGISGLSEQFVDFLGSEFPDQRVAAVAITHLHDDHSGGARAFAAAGATVYAPAGIATFLEKALNRASMPPDRLGQLGSSVDVVPVLDSVTIGDNEGQAKLVSLGPSPHVDDMLGLWAVEGDYFFVSDVHVPRSDSDTPGEERAATECWFAHKAVSLLPESVRVVNSHSGIVTPVSRLHRYLRSDACKDEKAGG